MFRSLYTIFFSSLLSLFAVSPVWAEKAPVTVFAAASLKDVLEEAGKAFTASGGPEVRFSFAASSALAKQIENGAPADLFASADVKWMDYVADKKLIRLETRTQLLGNTLVMVAPVKSSISSIPFTIGAIAEALGDGRLSLGEVNSVPAGIYAKAAFQKLGLWAALESKLAQTENVRAALVFVARGEAPLGVVYATDAMAEHRVKVVARFPDDSHEPIVYPFAVTTVAQGEGATQFLAYLKSPAGKAIFERAGFPVVGQ